MMGVRLHVGVAMAVIACLEGCVGTAMTTDPNSGATVPVQGWRNTTWQEDPAWNSFGPIGKKQMRQGPWWHGDPAWQFLTVGQGGRPELSRPSVADETVQAPAEAPAEPPAEPTKVPAAN